jgi:hypothetical protein
VDAYITYTLKDNTLNIKENNVMIIPNEYLRKNPNEDIPYEKIKAIYLKKELRDDFNSQAQKDHNEDYIFSCEIHFYHQKKVIIQNVVVKYGHSETSKNIQYEVFVKELLEKLIDFPQIKIYAYEGVKLKVLQKVNRVFPTLMIGSFIITGFSIAKILLKIFAATLKFGFNADFVILAIAFSIFSIGKMTNLYLKKNAQICGNEEVSPQFFPSFDDNQKLLKD